MTVKKTELRQTREIKVIPEHYGIQMHMLKKLSGSINIFYDSNATVPPKLFS